MTSPSLVNLPLDNRVFGLIPARGGSKSIPLKNLAPLAGRPLLEYIVRAALRSRTLDRIVCSTDHPRITQTCVDLGIDVIQRPDDLSQDDTPVTAVLLHFLQECATQDGSAPGMLVLLQPTSPFVLLEHIDACVEALRLHPQADSAQTVTPVSHNAHAFNQRVLSNGFVHFRFLEERRQAYNKQRKPKHYLFGNVVVSRSESLLKGHDCFGARSVPVEIPRVYSFDVDGPEDLEYAHYLVEKNKFGLVD